MKARYEAMPTIEDAILRAAAAGFTKPHDIVLTIISALEDEGYRIVRKPKAKAA